jgi:hypothetical protein
MPRCRALRHCVLAVLAVAFVVGCGGQKPAPAATSADTTAACCDSATLAKCRADSTGAGCGDCATPAPTDSGGGKTAPSPCSS